jgi:hypothetical protein
MSNTKLILGTWNVICDRCGSKKKAFEVAKEPVTNLIVCKDTCWEMRHPQEYVRAKPDDQTVPFTRPEQADVFVGTSFNCDTQEFQPIAPIQLLVDLVVAKGYITGPASIVGNMTVECTFEVR